MRAHVPQRSEQQRHRDEAHAASMRKMAVKVDGRCTSMKKPPTMPPTPMPRLISAKFTPKYCCRRSPPSTIAAITALKPGQDTPKFTPISTSPIAAIAGVVANASRTQPAIMAVSPASSTRRRRSGR